MWRNVRDHLTSLWPVIGTADLTICAYSRGIYPWQSKDRQQNAHFVEFRHEGSVKQAMSLSLAEHELRVHALVLCPHLITNFISAATPTKPSSFKRKRSGDWANGYAHRTPSSGWQSGTHT